MKNEEIEAARELVSSSAYQLIRRKMLEDLSKPANVLHLTDSALAKLAVHDVGIRNFFRWVELASQGESEDLLETVIAPFEHYGENKD